MILSPGSIMLKSLMASPTAWRRRLLSLLFSNSCLVFFGHGCLCFEIIEKFKGGIVPQKNKGRLKNCACLVEAAFSDGLIFVLYLI